MWACSGSQDLVHYNAEKKVIHGKSLEIEEIEIPPLLIFVGHGFFQNNGAGWSGKRSLPYHAYIVPEGTN